jgi:predicted nucleic acid-binding protein
LIPETVFHEVLAKPGKESMRIMDAARNFLIVQPPPASVHPAVKHATRYLDAGESEVIALASSIPAPVSVVIDDAAGRRVAARLSITLLGFVGVLSSLSKCEH